MCTTHAKFHREPSNVVQLIATDSANLISRDYSTLSKYQNSQPNNNQFASQNEVFVCKLLHKFTLKLQHEIDKF